MILIRLIVSPVLIVALIVATILLTIAGGLVWIVTGDPMTMNANYPDWR